MSQYINKVENKIRELKNKGNAYFIKSRSPIYQYVKDMKQEKNILVNRKNPYKPGTLLYKPDEIKLINDAFNKLDDYVNERENEAMVSENIEDITHDADLNQSIHQLFSSNPSAFHNKGMVAVAAASRKGGKRKTRRRRKLKKRKTMKKRKSRKHRKTKKRSKRR